MGVDDLMIPSHDTYRKNFFEASKDPPVEVINKKECGCYKTIEISESDRCWVTYTETVTNYFLCPEHMRKHFIPVSPIKREGSTENGKEVTMNTAVALTNFVDRLNAPAFPTLKDFIANSTNVALK